MKKGTGAFLALLGVAAGAVGTVFAIKKLKGKENYDYEEFDDDFEDDDFSCSCCGVDDTCELEDSDGFEYSETLEDVDVESADDIAETVSESYTSDNDEKSDF